MKTFVVVALALVSGFVAGLILSEVIGAFSVFLFNRPFGIQYLPVYLAVLSAAAALVAGRRFRSRSS